MMNSKCKLLSALNLLKQHQTFFLFYQRCGEWWNVVEVEVEVVEVGVVEVVEVVEVEVEVFFATGGLF